MGGNFECTHSIIIPYSSALLGTCAYTSTGKKYALIREMRLIKSASFNAGILRTTAKYVLNSEYAPISDMHLITRQYGNTTCSTKVIKCHNHCQLWSPVETEGFKSQR